MKKSILVLLALISMPILASTTTYTNEEGCKLVVEDTQDQRVYTLSQGDQVEVAKFTNHHMNVEFSYCSDKSVEVFFDHGSIGHGYMVFCDKNDSEKSIVEVEINSPSQKVNYVSITSEVKDEKGNWQVAKGLSCGDFL